MGALGARWNAISSSPSRHRAEGVLWRGVAWVASDRVYPWAVLVLALLGLVARVPDAATSSEVFTGHNDATTVLNAAYAGYLLEPEQWRPLPSGGSGWSLLLSRLYALMDVQRGPPVVRFDELPPSVQQAVAGDGADGPTIQQRMLANYPPGATAAVQMAYAASLCAAVLVVPLVVLVARQLTSRSGALLAGGIVAFEPSFLGSAGDALTEPMFLVLLLAGLFCLLKARDKPLWLLGAGAFFALGHMVRAVGLVLFLGLLTWYAWRTWGSRPRRAWLLWLAACLAAFALVASPYLLWRAEHLPGPFHLGQNQDFWADNFWGPGSYADPSGDHYLKLRTAEEYWASHTLTDAATRLWDSIWMQGRDFLLQASLPLLVLSAFGAWGLATGRISRRDFAVTPLMMGLTFAGMLWIYPLVASLRYFHPLTPFLAVTGAAAFVAWAQGRAHAVWVAAAGGAAYAGLYVAPALAEGVRHLPWVRSGREVFLLVMGTVILCILLAQRTAPAKPKAPVPETLEETPPV